MGDLMGKRIRRLKRRRPGVYVVRADRHLNPWRREFAYVGKARDLAARQKCHEGTCRHAGCLKKGPKDWLDLRPSWYRLELPWWLGFDFITLSLESLIILVLRPRYNWQKNPRRSKVGPIGQRQQRIERDARDAVYRAKIQAARWTNYVVRTAGVLAILVGLGGWWVTR
jgi:hypothetical protein